MKKKIKVKATDSKRAEVDSAAWSSCLPPAPIFFLKKHNADSASRHTCGGAPTNA